MFKVIACMAAGMVLGRFLRIKGLQKPIIAVTWLLLLFLGWETGSDREVIGALPSIGLASATLSIGGVAGSCILAWLLWKYMGGKVGEAASEDGQGARETGAGGDPQAVSGRELQTVSGLDMGTERRISVWSGMGGSLVILGFFTLGIILGLAGLPAGQSIVHKLSFWSLCILMAMVGMSVGGNPELVSSIRSMNPRIALLPIATILGTYAGCIIVNLFLGHSIADVLAIGSGFGYYSLSSVLISSSRGPHLGSIALISNIIREVFTLLCAPFLARIAGPLAPISSGGATTADTTLPIISSCCGDKFVLISIFHGFAVDFTVPFLVTLFCSLGQ
ncbi:MAG: lysine exporter LysO family protein [Bacteroidales bacterium]|nr:lysine exporter LysO family protein [Bacteroidales bacterium]